MHRHSFTCEGIGTHWFFTLYSSSKNQFLEIEADSIEQIAEFERTFSRFRGDSYISILNEKKILTDFPQIVFEVLSFGKEVAQLTQQHFTPFVGGLLHNKGYDAAYSFEAKNQPYIISDFYKISPREIRIDSGSVVDIGGYGKGWLIDMLVHRFKKLWNLSFFTINGGGDIYSTGSPERPEVFYLENPLDTHSAIGEIFVQDFAIASSSSNRRSWSDRKTGVIHHHLLDPHTQTEVQEISGTFIQAKTALIADTASTIAFVAPPTIVKKMSQIWDFEFLLVFPDHTTFASSGYTGKLYSDSRVTK